MKPTGPIPKRVKCIKAVTDSYTVGRLYNVNDNGFVIDNYRGIITKWDQGGKDNSHFNPIYTEEELLEYVKKMYPKGTEFVNFKNQYRKSLGENYRVLNNGCIELHATDAKDENIYQSDVYIPYSGWAEIISSKRSQTVDEEYAAKVDFYTPEDTAVKYPKKEEFLTELGNKWYSLVGYQVKKDNGKITKITFHHTSGHVLYEDGTDGDIHEMIAPHSMSLKRDKVLANSKPKSEYYPGTDSESFTVKMDRECRKHYEEEFNKAFSTTIHAPNHGIGGGKTFAKQADKVFAFNETPKYPIGCTFKFLDQTCTIIDYEPKCKVYTISPNNLAMTEERITYIINLPVPVIEESVILLSSKEKKSKLRTVAAVPTITSRVK